MLRYPPPGNGVVGNNGLDDPRGMLGGGGPVGGRGCVHLCALHGPSHGLVVEPAEARPVLVHLGENGAHHPDEQLPAGEHLHHTAAALELAVGALLHVVGAQPHVVLIGEVHVGQRIRLGLLEHLGGLRAEALYPADRQLVLIFKAAYPISSTVGIMQIERSQMLLPSNDALCLWEGASMSRRKATIRFTLFYSLFIALALVPNTAYADEGELGPAESVTIQEETALTPGEGATIPASNQTAREKSMTNVTDDPSEATGTSASEMEEVLATPVEDAATTAATQLPEPTTETQTVSTPSVQYAAHVSDQGWEPDLSKDGATVGTTGKARAIEALKISLANADGGIRYRSHCTNVGWQDWVADGAVAGTTGMSYSMQAIQIELTGNIASSYDVYYRIHAQNFGWLGWAKNGEIAGTTGWDYRAEAVEILLVKHGDKAPSSDKDAYIPSYYQTSITQEGESTVVRVRPDSLNLLRTDGVATDMRVTATMAYGDTVTRKVSGSTSLATINANGMALNVETYGPFTATIEYLKDGRVVGTDTREFGVTASEYNLAPLSASFPVVLYSISYWDYTTSATGTAAPSIVMLDRPSAFNWNALPSGMYAMPFMTEDAVKVSSDYSAFASYVKELKRLKPDSKFNLFINDITCSLIHSIIYANQIPQDNYKIYLLSDGTATYNFMNEAFNAEGVDPAAKEAQLEQSWLAAKEYAYKNGQASSDYGWHAHWDSMYAVLKCEPNTEWWMTRANLFQSADGNAFANAIATDPAVKKKNVASMLTALQQRGDATVAAFKALYNFNDGYFTAAEAEGKKPMVLLGTYVNLEQSFEDYAKLTMTYYGDEYAYYYKGHPNTPTGLWPSKQDQLSSLEITDIDSSVAAELILFFNPEVALSGYGSSTYNSATGDAGCGVFNMTKAAALSPSSTVDYSIMDWFASPISSSSDTAIQALCPKGDTCYLVEFSDMILKSADYDIAVFSGNTSALTYYKKLADGTYRLVRTKTNGSTLMTSAHVSGTGWISSVKEGKTAGTTGKSKALEAFKVDMAALPYSGTVQYQAHCANLGWQGWKNEGEVAGTVGESRQIEAIQMRLTNEFAEHYDIYYRAHVQDEGWLGWAKNGESAGTTGFGRRVEAIEVKLVEKDDAAPGSTARASIIGLPNVTAHVSSIGWQAAVHGTTYAGTTGMTLGVEALKLSVSGAPFNGDITYRSHVANQGWENTWTSNGRATGTTGKSRHMEALEVKLTGDLAKHYDILYRVHVSNIGWMPWVKNGVTAGTTGRGLPIEAVEMRLESK